MRFGACGGKVHKVIYVISPSLTSSTFSALILSPVYFSTARHRSKSLLKEDFTPSMQCCRINKVYLTTLT